MESNPQDTILKPKEVNYFLPDEPDFEQLALFDDNLQMIMKTKKIILNYFFKNSIDVFDGNFKVFEKILNSFANDNQKMYTKKFPKDGVETMKKMNDENKFMPLTVLK